MDKEISEETDALKDCFSAKYLKFADSSTQNERQISYYKVDGISRPGVVFVPGYMANKDHKKSLEVLKFCRDNGIPCVSYDTAGYGKSTLEIKRSEARFSHWLQDAREVLSTLTDGPQVVIGSSMGGWLSMILAQEMPDKFSGLLLLAPAYNWGKKFLNIITKFPEEVQKQMRDGLVVEKIDPRFPDYGEVPISFSFAEELIPFNVPLGENEIHLDFPIRILHGTKDEIIPVESSQALIPALTSDEVTLHIFKGCTHELSDKKGLEAIMSAVRELRKLSSL